MTRNRLHAVIAVAAMVLVAFGGFFLGVQPHLAQAASDAAQQGSVDSQNEAKATELARLREQAKSLPQLRSELAARTASVPATASMSSFYASLNSVADGTGVTVSAITTSDAVAYTPPAAASTSSDSAASASASPTAEASASPSAPTTTTDPSISSKNFSAIPVSVSVDGTFDQALAFVGGIQAAPRLFLVDAISSSASQDSTEDAASTSATTWTFGGYVYVLSDVPASGDTDTAKG